MSNQKKNEIDDILKQQNEAAAVGREEITQLRKERDNWKSEYENVCKFATQYEQERDEYRAALELIAVDASFNFQAKVLVHEAREVLAKYRTIK